MLLLYSSISCSGGYHAGSFESPRKLASLSKSVDFSGKRATVGCLDVALATHADVLAQGAAVRFTIANRCNRRTAVDFRRVAVFTASGERLLAFDPRGELRTLHLGARRVASETIEFRRRDEALGQKIGGVCIDVSGLSRAPQARPQAAGPVCLNQTAIAAREEDGGVQ